MLYSVGNERQMVKSMATIETVGHRQEGSDFVSVRMRIRKHLLDRAVSRAQLDGRKLDELVQGALLEYLDMCDTREVE